MLGIFKALIAASEKYVGIVEAAKLTRREDGKSYTHDGIQIEGCMKSGRKFCLELTVEDA